MFTFLSQECNKEHKSPVYADEHIEVSCTEQQTDDSYAAGDTKGQLFKII